MITIEPTGRIRFRVYLPGARLVEILGGFTGWADAPIPMSRTGEGWWGATVAVPPGDWRFRYRADGHAWATDFAAHGLEINAFGSLDSCLRVNADRAHRRHAA